MSNNKNTFLRAGALWVKKTKKNETFLQGFLKLDTETKYGMSEEDKKAVIDALSNGEQLFISLFKTERNGKSWYNVSLLNPNAEPLVRDSKATVESDEL